MALLRFHGSLCLPPLISSSFGPKPSNNNNSPPARDRIIDFGKHKGRMLGSLPSKYLLWVSKNLRARDTQHWAEFADDVLADPVYKDRVEWECAERFLSGDTANNFRSSSGSANSSVSELLEISERFGWDNEDKAGWARVDFGLLGTSKGGRIPRVADKERRRERKSQSTAMSEETEDRRERRRAKRGEVTESLRKEVGFDIGRKLSSPTSRQELGVNFENPFPGREALLDKIQRRREK